MGPVLRISHSRRLGPVLFAVVVLASAHEATATDYGAAFSGAWSNAANWAPAGGPPGASDGAYIGSNPSNFNEGAAFASIFLSGPQSVYNLALGYGPASGGTLDLAGYPLTVTTTIALGEFGGVGTIVHNGGYFTTQYLSVYNGNSLALAASDSITYLAGISDGSHLTTASSYNFATALSLTVDTGSTLTLGSSTSFGGTLDLEDSSTLDMGGHALSGNEVDIGWIERQRPVNVINRGPITATYFQVAAQPFNLIPADALAELNVANSGSVTTAAVANVATAVNVSTSSTLTLGSSMSIASTLYIEDRSTLNMAGHGISANQVGLGWNDLQPVNVINRGPITTQYLQVASMPFQLIAADSVGTFYLNNFASTALSSSVSVASLSLSNSSQASTTATGNITSNVTLTSGSTLTMGAPLSINGTLDLEESGTLNMSGYSAGANLVEIGWNSGRPVNVVNRGTISAGYLDVAGQQFNLISSDTVANLDLASSGQLATAATGNVTNSVTVAGGSTLTMGANMSLGGALSLQDADSTLNMQGHTLTASQIFDGWYGSAPITIANRGPLNANYLYVAYQPFSLAPPDTVTNFYLYDVAGSTLGSNTVSYLQLSASSLLTTTTTGNVTGSIDVESGSKLTMGANMALSGHFNLQDTGSTLDMQGHTLAANQIFDGWYGSAPTTIANRGPLNANYLYVAYQPFSLAPPDTVTNFYLYDVAGSTLGSNTISYLQLSASSLLTTTTTGNVTSSIDVESGSKLSMGANMALSGYFNLQDTGSTLDMGGHSLSANVVYLGWESVGVPTLAHRGPLNANYLYVAYQPFSLAPPDTVTNFYLYDVAGSTLGSNTVNYLQLSTSSLLTTTTSGNVTVNIDVESGSKLIMGANMTLSGNFNLRDTGSTLDMGGHKLTANGILLGWYGGGVTVARPGPVNTNYLYVSGSTVTLAAPGSDVYNQLDLAANGVAVLQQPAGQFKGLTFHASSSADLTIDNTSQLQLSGGSNSGPSWIFRWPDPASGTWESTLQSLIDSGSIAVSSTGGYSVFDDEGYTYVATPSTLIWNGSGGNTSWSNSGNWSGATPTAGHWLRFGPLAAGGHVANDNNLPANSLFYGIFFDSAAPAYNLQGNAIQLSGDVLNQSGTSQTIGLNIQLVPGDGAFNTNAITFDTGGMKITDSGSITGAGMMLVKTGSGTLVLSGSNDYSGGTEVLDGKLVIASSNSILSGTELIVGGDSFVFGAASVPASTAATPSVPVPVPEPGTLALLAAALTGFGFHRVRRRRRDSGLSGNPGPGPIGQKRTQCVTSLSQLIA